MSVVFKEYKAEYLDDFEEVLKPFRKMADANAEVAYGIDTSDENNLSMYLYVDRTLLLNQFETTSGFPL